MPPSPASADGLAPGAARRCSGTEEVADERSIATAAGRTLLEPLPRELDDDGDDDDDDDGMRGM